MRLCQAPHGGSSLPEATGDFRCLDPATAWSTIHKLFFRLSSRSTFSSAIQSLPLSAWDSIHEFSSTSFMADASGCFPMTERRAAAGRRGDFRCMPQSAWARIYRSFEDEPRPNFTIAIRSLPSFAPNSRNQHRLILRDTWFQDFKVFKKGVSVKGFRGSVLGLQR